MKCQMKIDRPRMKEREAHQQKTVVSKNLPLLITLPYFEIVSPLVLPRRMQSHVIANIAAKRWSNSEIMKAIVVLVTVSVNHHLKHEKTLVIMVDTNITEERVRGVIARMNPPSHLVIVTPKVDVYIILMYNYEGREE